MSKMERECKQDDFSYDVEMQSMQSLSTQGSHVS